MPIIFILNVTWKWRPAGKAFNFCLRHFSTAEPQNFTMILKVLRTINKSKARLNWSVANLQKTITLLHRTQVIIIALSRRISFQITEDLTVIYGESFYCLLSYNRLPSYVNILFTITIDVGPTLIFTITIDVGIHQVYLCIKINVNYNYYVHC